jgi:hypothetical protein
MHLTADLRHLACRRLDARLRARRDTDPTVLGQQKLGNSPAEPSAGGGDQRALAPQAQLHDPMLEPRPRQMPPFTTARDTAAASRSSQCLTIRTNAASAPRSTGRL